MGFAILLVLIFFVAIIVFVAQAVSKANRRKQIIAEARAFAASVQRARALPIVQINLIRKNGEFAYFSQPASLYETKAVRHYQSGHSGMRVAKGLYIGRTSGRSTSTQEWSRIDVGRLTVTNLRLVFDGQTSDRTVPLKKILSVDPSFSAVEVSVEGRQKSMVFEVDNAFILAWIIRVCCQVNDPSNLAEIDLRLTIND